MTDAPTAARAACAGSDASAAMPCAPSGACPPRLTARTSRPACTNSVTTAPPMAPVAPKTTCKSPSSSVIVMLLLLIPMVPGAEHPRSPLSVRSANRPHARFGARSADRRGCRAGLRYGDDRASLDLLRWVEVGDWCCAKVNRRSEHRRRVTPGPGSVTGVMPGEIALLGVPTNSSGTADGVARAPAVLRQRGLAAALARWPGFTDVGDLVLPARRPARGPSGLLAEEALVTMIGQVRDAVAAARGSGRFPLLVGGDCPVILGALAALQADRGRPGLLFVDGHEDAWPPRLSPTGEAADSELGLALGLFDADLDVRLRAVLPRISAAAVVAVGPRDEA